jgi:hypothetical protein
MPNVNIVMVLIAREKTTKKSRSMGSIWCCQANQKWPKLLPVILPPVASATVSSIHNFFLTIFNPIKFVSSAKQDFQCCADVAHIIMKQNIILNSTTLTPPGSGTVCKPIPM